MLSRIGFLIFILTNSYAFEETFEIRGSFKVCQATDILIETSITYTDFQLFNLFTYFKGIHKEFFQIKLSLNQILSVYSFNGNLFFANCSDKQSIYVPLTQTKSSRDLPVFIESNKTKQYYLNHKSKIIGDQTMLMSGSNIKKKFT